ncbi:MAG: ABC transporter permease subunit [Agathobacter sp.]|nr:ABC transporter permease subunit [Agathobacter sp.]
MRQLTAFIQKEFTEVMRNSKLLICAIIFILLGIMNPAIAKITPWLVEQFSNATSGAGMLIQTMEISALTSWEQFFKNMPMGIVFFVLMFSGIVAAELQKGTLINIVTKGMPRWKIMVSKLILLLVLWTGMYFASYIITYVYNDFYWDNDTVNNIFFSVLCLYLFGVWLISLIMLMSALADNSAAVSMGVCGVFLLSYLLGIIPTVQDYLPTKLKGSSSLIYELAKPADFTGAIVVVAIWSLADIIMGIFIFNKKNL